METIYCPNKDYTKHLFFKEKTKARCIGCEFAQTCKYRKDIEAKIIKQSREYSTIYKQQNVRIMKENQEIKMQLLEKFANIEKPETVAFCKEVFKWLNEDQDVDTPQVSAAIESKPDGIYLVSEDGSVILFGPEWKKPESPVKYIGVKWGSRSLAVALHDQANGEDITLTAKKDETEYDGYIDTYLDAVANWTGKANTEHLKQIGLNKEISLAENEYIPSLGEMLFVFLNRKAINEALEAVGGTPIDGVWYWTSTEGSATIAWTLYLDDGTVDSYYASKASGTFRVRAVSAFQL